MPSSSQNVDAVNEACLVFDLGSLLHAAVHAESYSAPMRCNVRCATLFDTANNVADAELQLRARLLLPPEDLVADRIPVLHASDTLSYFDLRAEMDTWMRARRAVGMNPEEYEHVVRLLHTFTNETQSTNPADDEPLFPPLGIQSSEEAGRCVAEDRNRSTRCHWAEAVQAYRLRASRTLRDMPWLLVDRATLREAKTLYADHVLGGMVLRVYHLGPAPRPRGTDSAVVNLLRLVQRMWRDAERRAEDLMDVGLPLLPSIELEDFVGPAVPFPRPWRRNTAPFSAIGTQENGGALWGERERGHAPGDDSPRDDFKIPVRLPFRHSPYNRVLPTAVVYHYPEDDEDCPLCSLYGAAFDLLPSIFHHMCVAGHANIVSCSPLVLFISAKETDMNHRAPRFSLYARVRVDGAPNPMKSLAALWYVLSGGELPSDRSPEYDIPSNSYPTYTPDRQRIGSSVSFGAFAGLLRRPDDFQAQTIRISRKANNDLLTVLVDIMEALVDHGSVQLRSLSMEEVAGILMRNELVRHRAREAAQSNKTGVADNATVVEEEGREEPEPQFAGLQKIVSAGEGVRQLVDGHLAVMYGRSPDGRYSISVAQVESYEAKLRRLPYPSILCYAWYSLSLMDRVTLVLSACAVVWWLVRNWRPTTHAR